jgi:hypothetical protein
MTQVGAQTHSHTARGDDLYETAPEAVYALIKAEYLPPVIWEPACGRGSIVGVLREAGHLVIATDLNNRGCPTSLAGIDFLTEHRVPSGATCIVTNPPYKLAQEFAEHALRLCPRVIMLLRLAFLESERRTGILENGRLARVHIFRNRLPMMSRDGWNGPIATSSICFAWYVWTWDHKGPPMLHRISWEARND